MSANCSVKPAIVARPRAVKVNGVTIAREEIARETQNHPASKPIDAWKSAARALAVRELLQQEALRIGVSADPMQDDEGRRETDDEARVRRLVEQEVTTPEPDESTCRRYYEQNSTRFRSPDLFEVSHILIGVGAEADEAHASSLARQIIERLRAEPSTFADLAKTYSVCPSREMGGNLGQIGPGQTTPEFERALTSMHAGVVHDEPVRSRYGYHVVRVERRIDGVNMPFELVKDRISAYLAERVRRTAIRQYISLLAGRASIEGIDLEAATSPLLQ